MLTLDRLTGWLMSDLAGFSREVSCHGRLHDLGLSPQRLLCCRLDGDKAVRDGNAVGSNAAQCAVLAVVRFAERVVVSHGARGLTPRKVLAQLC